MRESPINTSTCAWSGAADDRLGQARLGRFEKARRDKAMRGAKVLLHTVMALMLGLSALSVQAWQESAQTDTSHFGPRKDLLPAQPHPAGHGAIESQLPPPLLRRPEPIIPGYNDPESLRRIKLLEAWRSLPGYYPMRFGDPTKPQICTPETIRPTTPTEDFIDHGDGTVTHKLTGLMWMRCSMGQAWDGTTCTGDILRSNWETALKAAEELNRSGGFAGYTDWRLPNIKELTSIVERACVSPAANLEIFPKTENIYYWSSTPYALNYFKADGPSKWQVKEYWGTYFYTGKNTPGFKTIRRSRLVRDPK